MRTKFNTCLNQPIKMWNLPVLALFFAVIAGIIGAILKGMMFGFGGAIGGFILGGYMAQKTHTGELQRWVYWHLPSSFISISNICLPSSHLRVFF